MAADDNIARVFPDEQCRNGAIDLALIEAAQHANTRMAYRARVLLNPDGTAFKAFDVQGVPVAILVDENGKVVHYWVGLDDPSRMDSV